MEQVTIFIMLAIAIGGLLAWSMGASSRYRHYEDRYPPSGPYPYPYPPYPYPPQPSPVVGLLIVLTILAVVYLGLMYLKSTSTILPYNDQNKTIHQILETEGEMDQEVGGDRMPGGKKGYVLPDIYESDEHEQGQIPAEIPQPIIRLEDGYFVQNGAFSEDNNVLAAAQQLLIRFPGRVWIGVFADASGAPLKVLIGPYASRAEIKAIHGAGGIVRQPGIEGIQIYEPR